MGDASTSYKSNCKPVPGIRTMLRQAPLNIENMPSRVKGSNVKVLPPKFGSGGAMSMDGGGCCGPPKNYCVPPTGCYMPAPMCSPYPVPMCTPCPYPCPPQQMCYPPQCPPAFCCPQPCPQPCCPQPYYSQFPCMPPPKCCPPPPCPPPPCCKTEIDPCNPCGIKKESQCCGTGKTLICMPKGQRPGQVSGRGCNGNAGGPSMDQPASYNNCNFYVHELPKGMTKNMNNMMGRATATSEDRVDENCDEDPRDEYTDPNVMNIPAGDGKVFPPPGDRPWGNDDAPITGSSKRNDYNGGGGGAARDVNGATRNRQHLCKPVGPPVRKDMNGNHMTYGNRTTPTTANRTTPTTGNRTTATRQTGDGNENDYFEVDVSKIRRNSMGFGKPTLQTKPDDDCYEHQTDGTRTAGTFGRNTTVGTFGNDTRGTVRTSDGCTSDGFVGHGGRKGPGAGKSNVNVHVKGHPRSGGARGCVTSGPVRSGTRSGAITSDDVDDGRDDDGRGPNGRGVRKKGGFAGGIARDAPSADYCIAQDHHKAYCPVTWKRKHPCCMPLKSRKLKTLCQKCHQRYAPKGTEVDEHCGLPMPSPAQNSRGGARGGHATGTASTVKHSSHKEVVQHRAAPHDHEVHVTQQRIQANTNGMQTSDFHAKIDMKTHAYPAQHHTYVAHQALIIPTNRPINLDYNTQPNKQTPVSDRGATPFSAPQYKVESPVTSFPEVQTPRSKNSDDSSESESMSDSDSYSRSSSSSEDEQDMSPHKRKPDIGIQKGQTTGVHVAQDSMVHLMSPKTLDSSLSYEIANPLHHQVIVPMTPGHQRNFIANIVSVPEFRLPPELFQRYQPFPTIRSRSTNHIHELRKTAVRKSIPFATGNTEFIANYMTIAANADPRLNVHFQTPQQQITYQIPTNNQPFQFGANQGYQVSTNQTYQVPNSQDYQIATNTTYQAYPQQCPVSTQNPACTTREVIPSHSEIQRIVITKDPNKHTQNIKVVKQHVPHHSTNQPVCNTFCQELPSCPVEQAQQCPIPIPQCAVTIRPQCPLPQPQCPVPQPQCPLPQPQCPVPQPQCPLPKPQCPVPRPQCPIPKPPCQISIQPQCPVSIQAQHSLRIQPQCPLNIDPQPHQIIGSKIETFVRQDQSGSHVRVGINQMSTKITPSHTCLPKCETEHHTQMLPSVNTCRTGNNDFRNQQGSMSHYSTNIYATPSRCGAPSHGLISSRSQFQFTSTVPQSSTCAPTLYSILDTSHRIASSRLHPPTCGQQSQTLFSTVSNSCMVPPRPPPTTCAQKSYGIYSTASITYLPNGCQKHAEMDCKNTNSVAATIRGIYGDPIRPQNNYPETVRIPHPTTSYTINSYEQPYFGMQPYRTQTRTQVTFNPGTGMGRVPECVHHTPTVLRIPPTSGGCPPPCRSLPKLKGDICQTELKNAQCCPYQSVVERPYQPHGHQQPIPVYRTTTQTQMQIIQRPNHPSEVRIIKTPVTVMDEYPDVSDSSGRGHGGRGRSRGGRVHGPPPRNVQTPGLNSNGGYYQDTKKSTRPGKNSCGVSPCGPSRVPCFPLRPCRSPRLITCKGQKPIFSAFPPACPIRETRASILAKKPPANCQWHEKDIPPFYDYCMPSKGQYQDPMHQRVTYIDHCGQDSSNPQPHGSQHQTKNGHSNHKGPGASSKHKGRPGRGVKRRLN